MPVRARMDIRRVSRSSSDGDPLIVRRARERREGGVDGRRDSDSSAGRDRDVAERFGAFYDFAFPRVYRFAQRRMGNEAQAEALCGLILLHALTSLGGIDALETERLADPTESAIWLYFLVRKVADEVAEKPELLVDLSEAGSLDAGRSLLFLAKPRPVAPTNARGLAVSKNSSKPS